MLSRKLFLSLAACLAVSTFPEFAIAQGLPGGNPVVIDSGRHVTGIDFDPWADQIVVQRHRDLVRASALDPTRGYVDPGSLHYVNRYLRDAYGRLYREQGYKWTSFGVPHGDLTKTLVYGGPNIRVQDSTRVQYLRVPPTPGVRVEDSTRVQYLRRP